MKKTISLLVILLVSNILIAQDLYPTLFDGSGGIVNGYGSWGSNNYIRESSIDVPNKGTITFYHPDVTVSQKPTMIFISGWGREYQTYDKYFKYVASLGYSVINIYNLNPGSINTSYQNSVDMAQQAVATYPNWIDTTKIGLAGHSYGGGSTIWIGNQLFNPNGLNWGTNGRFIMMFAPWYPFLIEDTELQNYPDNVKLIVLQSFDDFHSGGPLYNTDPQVLRAMYQLINIPNSEKDFITVFSDNDVAHEYNYNGTTFSYQANHYISYTDLVNGNNNPYDRLDVYAMNRLTNAMTAYVFEGDDNAAKDVALGNGSTVQKDMGILPDLAVTDAYVVTRPESAFEYKCTADATDGAWNNPSIWKLSNYCIDSNNDGVIDVLRVKDNLITAFNVFPVPTIDYIKVKFNEQDNQSTKYEIYDLLGNKLVKNMLPLNNTISVSNLEKGVYLLKIIKGKNSSVRRFVVK